MFNNMETGQRRFAVTAASLQLPARVAFDRIAERGDIGYVQLDAAQPGMRPRELDRSARRDLLATLRRRELSVSGVDLWIPPRHFSDPERVDRATSAMIDAIDFAAELDRSPISIALPAADQQGAASALKAIAAHAARAGVPIADHTIPIQPRSTNRASTIGVGIDPAAWLSRGDDPSAAVSTNAEHLVAVRLCDLLTSASRGPIADQSEGQLDVIAYRVAIDTAGVRDPIIIDTRQWANPWQGLDQTVRAWSTTRLR